MNMDEKLSLKWNEFEKCSSQTFKDLLEIDNLAYVLLFSTEVVLVLITTITNCHEAALVASLMKRKTSNRMKWLKEFQEF